MLGSTSAHKRCVTHGRDMSGLLVHRLEYRIVDPKRRVRFSHRPPFIRPPDTFYVYRAAPCEVDSNISELLILKLGERVAQWPPRRVGPLVLMFVGYRSSGT